MISKQRLHPNPTAEDAGNEETDPETDPETGE